jgi:hypothetical protein
MSRQTRQTPKRRAQKRTPFATIRASEASSESAGTSWLASWLLPLHGEPEIDESPGAHQGAECAILPQIGRGRHEAARFHSGARKCGGVAHGGGAQQGERIARIGYLAFSSATQNARFSAAFREGLRDLGYVEGINLIIESRYADGDNDRLPGLATELVGLNVDIIVTYATGVTAGQHVTPTIPIVIATYADAVAVGVVGSVGHPGGNVTELTFFISELMAKRLELLKEVVPSMITAAFFCFGAIRRIRPYFK